jgi:hypothetical protein
MHNRILGQPDSNDRQPIRPPANKNYVPKQQTKRKLKKDMTMTANLQDFQKLGQVNVEGSMKAIADWQKGLQTIATEFANYSKRSMEDSAQTFEKLLAVKSLDQALEIQTGFAKRATEGYMQQMTKIGGLYGEFAKEVTKPIANVMQTTR